MNWKRILTLVTIGGAVAALVTSAATTGRRPPDPSPDRGGSVRSVEDSGAALAAEIARLRARLHPSIAPQAPARNLFEYHARPAARGAVPPSAPAPVTVEPLPVPPAPVLTLIGIASDADAAGATIRTAIISGAGDLFLVKEGEAVTPRYRVVKISESVVELADTEQAATVRLALK